MSKYLKNNNTKSAGSTALKRAKRNIYWQAGLAMVTIVLTIVILFAMTAAWYTNIVQTSGLVFQAEAWGFDGTIRMEDKSVEIAPGDEGLICLEVENTSSSIAAVSVTASKSGITTYPDMKRRLYVYADAQMVRNGETMERVYLNSLDSYTYTLFANGKLVLSEDTHSDAQLKWQWVYDMLGYYVLGTWTEDTTGQNPDGGTFTELEYLRPVEYDLDAATFEYVTDDTGITTIELKTVDGKTTVKEFLAELSKKDGYENDIGFDKAVGKGYYPVEVDDKGYGVYVYLCNYAEIEIATQYDTDLGIRAAQAAEQGIEMPTYPIQLNVSAQKNDENLIKVTSVTGLNEAMRMLSGTVVQLSENITLDGDDVIQVPVGSDVILDMNGYEIISNTGGNVFKMDPGSAITVTNGTITGTQKGTGFHSVGAEVTLYKVNISGFTDAIYVADFTTGNELDSRVRIVDCDINALDCAVYMGANGSASAQKTQLVVEDSTLRGDGVVIYGNGRTDGDGRWGTDIQIMNSHIIGNASTLSVGIFHPQKDSELTIYNSTVTAYSGIQLKGGHVQILGSTIEGTGAALNREPNPQMSGCDDTGDGLYVETNYGYEIQVDIRGVTIQNEDGTETYVESELKSTNNHSLRVVKASDPNVVIRIVSGKFKEEQHETYIARGSEQLLVDGVYLVRLQEEQENP